MIRHWETQIGARTIGTCRMRPSEIADADDDTSWHAKRDCAGSPSFYGGVSEHEARQRLTTGWDEGATEVLALSRTLVNSIPRPVNVRRRQRWMDVGSELNIDRALRGEWDTAWRGAKQTPAVSTQLVHILMPWAFSAAVAYENIKWSGVVALAVMDALEGEGWQVDLKMVNYAPDGYSHSHLIGTTVIELKEAGEVVNLSSLAAVAASPSTFRWYGLYINCNVKAGGWFGAGYYGNPELTPAKIADLIHIGVLGDAQYVVMQRPTSRDAAIAEANRVIQLITKDAEARMGARV